MLFVEERADKVTIEDTSTERAANDVTETTQLMFADNSTNYHVASIGRLRQLLLLTLSISQHQHCYIMHDPCMPLSCWRFDELRCTLRG